MKRYLELIFVSLISILIAVSLSGRLTRVIDGGSPWSNGFGCSTEDITDMYAGYVEQWKKEVKNAFDEAEIKIYNITPTPDIVGPNEDPDKCVCKGTGVITHGDGHKTSCPYHGSKFNKPLLIWEE